MIHYDLVAKFENLQEDIYPLFGYLKSTIENILPAKYGPQTNSGHKKTITSYYSSIDDEMLEKLKKVYQIDFDLFGYEKDIPNE